jgi:RNA polymerase sigma-70 factor (ECF subfamily)
MGGVASADDDGPEGLASVQRALVDMARSGDEEAFGALARAAGDRLMAIAFRILRDTGLAEDAVQQALIAAWRELPALRDPDRFDAWLHRLLVNACYAEGRRARRWSANVRALPLDGPAGRDDTVDVAHRDELERGFRRLPLDQRTVFVFHHYLGLDLREIAEQLGIPQGTVKSRLHYAMHALRAGLEADARTSPTINRERGA